jgi:ubiquinone/menaquinone biosynthesis C-methylase UbiE
VTTLERFSPDAWAPNWIRLQHIARYQWATKFARGANVVDAACGTGYGSKLLSQSGAASVHGFDLCPQTIARAKEQLGGDRLYFTQADVTALPLAARSVDLLVCFETIEHVADDRGLLREAVRVLRPGGRFLCSSPNRLLTNPGTGLSDRPFNEHHVREYSTSEFASLLAEHFRQVTLLGQSFYSTRWASTLKSAARLRRISAVRLQQVRKLLSSPFQQLSQHMPRELCRSAEPEFILADCLRY